MDVIEPSQQVNMYLTLWIGTQLKGKLEVSWEVSNPRKGRGGGRGGHIGIWGRKGSWRRQSCFFNRLAAMGWRSQGRHVMRHFEERIYWFIFKRGRIRCRICKKNIFSKNENHALSFIIKPTSRSGSGLWGDSKRKSKKRREKERVPDVSSSQICTNAFLFSNPRDVPVPMLAVMMRFSWRYFRSDAPGGP